MGNKICSSHLNHGIRVLLCPGQVRFGQVLKTWGEGQIVQPSTHLAVEDSDSNNDLVVLLVVGVDEEGNTGIILCGCRQRTILGNKFWLISRNIHLQAQASPSTSWHPLNCFSTIVEKYQNLLHYLLKKSMVAYYCETNFPPSSWLQPSSSSPPSPTSERGQSSEPSQT